MYCLNGEADLLTGGDVMNYGKVIIAASAATVCAAGITAACIIICKRLFEKHYIPVSDLSGNA